MPYMFIGGMAMENLNEIFIDIFHRLDDFLFTPTRLSNPVLRCFCTIGNFINSSHDSLKMTPPAHCLCSFVPRDLISLLRWLHILFYLSHSKYQNMLSFVFQFLPNILCAASN